MGRTRKLLALTAAGAIALPPLAAAILRSRYEYSGEDDDDLRVAAIFEGSQVRATSRALRRGEALAWYGALDLDLRGASLDPAGARLRVVALFAGARVIVPAGWEVRVRPVAAFGGVDARVEPPLVPGPHLTIEAVAVFAGVRITDRPIEDEPDVVLERPGVDAGRPSDDPFARAEAAARLEATEAEGAGSDGAEGTGSDGGGA